MEKNCFKYSKNVQAVAVIDYIRIIKVYSQNGKDGDNGQRQVYSGGL